MLTITAATADGATAVATLGLEPNAAGGFSVAAKFDHARYDEAVFD